MKQVDVGERAPTLPSTKPFYEWPADVSLSAMNLEIKRPRGVTVFIVLGILDAIVMAVFVAMFLGTPELYAVLFPAESQLDLSQYAVLKFDDWVLELGVFVIIIDCVAVAGLLSAKPRGMKAVSVCAMIGIVFNVLVFGIPGLLANSILLWYMFRSRTREYFKGNL